MSNKNPDLGLLMKQAQQMQSNMAKAQADAAKLTCEGQSGGGMVVATVNGEFALVGLKIDKTVVDPNDVGMLQDLVTTAVNAACVKVREETQSKMTAAMGGMNMPGIANFFK